MGITVRGIEPERFVVLGLRILVDGLFEKNIPEKLMNGRLFGVELSRGDEPLRRQVERIGGDGGGARFRQRFRIGAVGFYELPRRIEGLLRVFLFARGEGEEKKILRVLFFTEKPFREQVGRVIDSECEVRARCDAQDRPVGGCGELRRNERQRLPVVFLPQQLFGILLLRAQRKSVGEKDEERGGV